MDFRDLETFADALADAAAEATLPHFRTNAAVEDKGGGYFDPVTEADRHAESTMRKMIHDTFPEHGIIGEEHGPEREDAEFVWVLDPIDGTRSFITGIPLWGTLIGLLHEGEPILGMMAQPFTRERYVGNGKRAWYRGPGGERALAARPCPSLAGAALFTTTPALFGPADRLCYDRVEGSVRIARYGADCYAYCMVAAGNADVVVETELKPYDIVALIPIIQGAGGRVTNWEGGSATAGGRIVAVGDPRLHDQVLKRIAEAV